MQNTPTSPPRQQPLLYHDLITPEEVLHIREEVRRFADAEVAPRAWEIGHREEARDLFPRMAERATEIENARNLYLKAALRMDAGVSFPEPEAAMAKYYATQLAGEFAREGVQIFGGYGFIRELRHDQSRYHVEEVYRDAKIAEIYEGANEIQKWIIARTIFGKEFTG